MAVGIVISTCLSILVTTLWEGGSQFDQALAGGYVLAGGLFVTTLLLNRYVGGGKDV